MNQKITQGGIDLIKQFEGLALTAFRDLGGSWSIGYGHTEGVVEGSSLTAEEAELLLLEELHNVETRVSSLLKVSVNANEFSALISLAYNIGTDGFAGSAILKRINRGDRLGAADGFDWWTDIELNGKKIESAGLKHRRAAEKTLFLTPLAEDKAVPNLSASTSVQPLREGSPRRRNFWASRSIKVGLFGTFFAIVQVLHHVARDLDPNTISYDGVRLAIVFVQGLRPEAFAVSSAIVLITLFYLIYVRFDDWRNYRR